MKSKQEVSLCKKVIIDRTSHDGYAGMIYLRGWKGTFIATYGGGWDHVSVSPLKHSYVPSWDDMCEIKGIFFNEEEAVIQIHPPKSEYVNNLSNCLHLWRANDKEMILPPSFMVGIRVGQTQAELMKEIRDYYEQNGYEW